jgi:hypothetical protein
VSVFNWFRCLPMHVVGLNGARVAGMHI